ncbi:hypothetical protein K525DRAFT_195300, partial [Schizophyllum commune Loenen D]
MPSSALREPIALCAAAHEELTSQSPPEATDTPLPYLRGRFVPDARVVARLEETAVEIRGIVSKLLPDAVLPADVKHTTRSLDGTLYSARQRQWLKDPTPSPPNHIACQARETAQLLNAIGDRCAQRLSDQR